MQRNEADLETERRRGAWRPLQFPMPIIPEEAAYIRPEMWREIVMPLLAEEDKKKWEEGGEKNN